MLHSHGTVAAVDLNAGSARTNGMTGTHPVAHNAVGTPKRPTSSSVKAGIKEFMKQEAMGSPKLGGDTNTIRAEPSCAKIEYDQDTSNTSIKAELLDKVENVLGELSQALSAPYEDHRTLHAGSHNDSMPLKSQIVTRQNVAGPQSAYMKTSLSTINEDGPLDERFAAEWEASKQWKGHNANSHVHGILLPDWHVWAEQVSQLLNHFATEIGVLTSRVDCIDQRLNCKESANPRDGRCDSVCTESFIAPSKPSSLITGSAIDDTHKSLRAKQEGNQTLMADNSSAVVVMSPSIGLTAHELDWLMAPEASIVSPQAPQDSGKSGAVLVPVATDSERKPRLATSGLVPTRSEIGMESNTTYVARVHSPTPEKRNAYEVRRQVNSPPPTKVMQGRHITSPRVAMESQRQNTPSAQSRREADECTACSSTNMVHKSGTLERVPLMSEEAIRSEAEKERLRRLKEMQEWRLRHAQETTTRQDHLFHPPPQLLPASPSLDKFRSPPLPTRSVSTAAETPNMVNEHATFAGHPESALSAIAPRILVESPVTSLRLPPGSSTAAPSSPHSRTSPWSDSSGQEPSPRHEALPE